LACFKQSLHDADVHSSVYGCSLLQLPLAHHLLLLLLLLLLPLFAAVQVEDALKLGALEFTAKFMLYFVPRMMSGCGIAATPCRLADVGVCPVLMSWSPCGAV
jgi:hypothetical protein